MTMTTITRIRMIGDVLPGTERYYQGPSTREALLTAAVDWCLAGWTSSVREAYRLITALDLWEEVGDDRE